MRKYPINPMGKAPDLQGKEPSLDQIKEFVEWATGCDLDELLSKKK